VVITKKFSIVGNSKGILLSKEIRKALGLQDTYKMTVLKDKIIIEKE
jgi:antitoxin component of MazEF toxin-antitoxin module